MLETFVRVIKTVNEWTGKTAAWLIIPLVIVVTWDVIGRYIFNRPLIWGWDVNIQFLGGLVILGGGYVLLHDGHVRVDVLIERLSERKRVVLELVMFPLFLFTFGLMLWEVALEAWTSVGSRELYTSVFSPPIYPFRVVIAIGCFLLFLQGMGNFIENVLLLKCLRKL